MRVVWPSGPLGEVEDLSGQALVWGDRVRRLKTGSCLSPTTLKQRLAQVFANVGIVAAQQLGGGPFENDLSIPQH